jgi:hypothetical protein
VASRIHQLRLALDAACLAATQVDQDGPLVEHLNHRLLEAGRALGVELDKVARPMVVDYPECPGPYCLMCNGEACNLCGASCWNNAAPHCHHGSDERHMDPARRAARAKGGA